MSKRNPELKKVLKAMKNSVSDVFGEHKKSKFVEVLKFDIERGSYELNPEYNAYQHKEDVFIYVNSRTYRILTILEGSKCSKDLYEYASIYEKFTSRVQLNKALEGRYKHVEYFVIRIPKSERTYRRKTKIDTKILYGNYDDCFKCKPLRDRLSDYKMNKYNGVTDAEIESLVTTTMNKLQSVMFLEDQDLTDNICLTAKIGLWNNTNIEIMTYFLKKVSEYKKSVKEYKESLSWEEEEFLKRQQKLINLNKVDIISFYKVIEELL